MDVTRLLDAHLSQSPRIDPTAWVSRQAYVSGDVELGPGASVWPMCVLRGDINRIVVGAGSNIQDGSIVHLADDYGVTIGPHVTIGHGAIIHACEVRDGALIGMGATILDGAVIGENSIIGARALVPLGMEVPPNSMVLGLPGKVVRELSVDERQLGRYLAGKYEKVAARTREWEAANLPPS
ncbi:MAG: gamma carbonic anhydrase family protein [Verrucomicrobiota bacterium]